MPPKLFIAPKGFVIHDGKVLILRESGSYEEGTRKGLYDIPGGRLNPGERYDEALTREIREETVLSVTIGEVLGVDEWRPTVKGEEWQIVGIFFECHAKSSAVTVSSDHDHFEWIDPKNYTEYPIIENYQSTFEKLKNRSI